MVCDYAGDSRRTIAYSRLGNNHAFAPFAAGFMQRTSHIDKDGLSRYLMKWTRYSVECNMTQFDEREKAFENKFAHDAEMEFRAASRRNRLVGLWAAEKMGLIGADAEAYAREVVKADLEEAGEEDVFRKLRRDLDAREIQVSDSEIRHKMAETMAEAKEQILQGL